MAHYVATVRTPRAREEVFAYLSDLSNFEQWDPGVSSSTQVSGDGPGLGAEYAVRANRADLRYVVEQYRAGHELTFKARTRFFTSLDRVAVVDEGDGSRVVYDAVLTLNGPLGLLDVAIRPMFRRIGDAAAAGLADALDGELIT
jgi:carbon monoxide dehydrogenase subunit G